MITKIVEEIILIVKNFDNIFNDNFEKYELILRI